MNSPRDERVRALFDEVVERPIAERETYLARVCDDWPSLMQDVLQLLENHDASETEGFLEPTTQGSSPPWIDPVIDLDPGTTLGDFEILEEIGRGGSSIVYRARQRGVGRIVALKVFLDRDNADPTRKSRFETEAEAVGRVQHPGIVQIYLQGEHQGHLYLALEYVSGGNLFQKLEKGPLAPREAAQLLQQLAEAIATTHRCGLIHRDLKPSNILLDSNGFPRITDFGLAKPMDGAWCHTLTGEVLGTPGYMAPEQIDEAVGKVGPAADLFALGVILYQAMTGQKPFPGSSPIKVLDAIRHDEPVPPRHHNPDISEDLETICLTCLQKRPEQRYASAESLADDLRRTMRGQPIRTRKVGPLHRIKQKAGRHRTAMFIALATTMLVALGGLSVASAVRRQTAHAASRATAESLVHHLQAAKFRELPALIRRLGPYRPWADSMLRELVRQSPEDSNQQIKARIALFPVDSSQSFYLANRLLTAPPDEFEILRDLLRHSSAVADLMERSRAILDQNDSSPESRLRAASVLAALVPSDNYLDQHASAISQCLLDVDHASAMAWAPLLRGARRKIAPHLLERLGKETNFAADLTQNSQLLQELVGHDSSTLQELEARILESHAPQEGSDYLELEKAHANRITALALLGRPNPLWLHLRHSDDPTLRSLLIERLGQIPAIQELMINRLSTEADVSALRALILALGERTDGSAPPVGLEPVAAQLLQLYEHHPDAGLHGAIAWTLERWGMSKSLRSVDAEMELRAPEDRSWWVNSQAQLFSILDIPSEAARPHAETDDPVTDYRLAIAVKEVTPYQFNRFALQNPTIEWDFEFRHLFGSRDCAALGILRAEAAAYCNWLSAFEGLSEDQWCYVPLQGAADQTPNLVLASDFLQRTGYRLPTLREWQYACMADAKTPYFFGRDPALHSRYGWWLENSKTISRSVGTLRPNDFGLFDMYGNVYELCEGNSREERPGQCGGSFLMFSNSAPLIDTHPWSAETRGESVGIRLARRLGP